MRGFLQTRRCFWSGSAVPAFREVLKTREAGQAPTLETVVAHWSAYPAVVAQLQQLNNTFGELQKDNAWSDVEKQFRHDPNARTIDWAFLEQNFGFPEVASAYKEALEKIKFEDIQVDEFFVSMDKITEEFSAEIREQNAKYQEMLPGLRKDLERSEFLKANISTLTVDDMRASNPQIFSAIDKEIYDYNWDEEPIVETAHKEKHH